MIDFDLRGRSALVTGGSRGIGAAISKRLAEAGATVIVHYRGDTDGAAGRGWRDPGARGRADAVAADLTDGDIDEVLLWDVYRP